MRTSEDAGESGLYMSECCIVELIFTEGDTFLALLSMPASL